MMMMDASGTTASPDAESVFSLSEQETLELGRSLARALKGGELILLEGDLGMGKTVFARGVAVGLGVQEDEVRSPSFNLVHEYEGGRYPLFHVDLYRLDDGDDLEGLGLEELTQGGGVVLVEWGEKLPPWYKRDALTVRFLDLGEGSRRIEIDRRDRPAERLGDA